MQTIEEICETYGFELGREIGKTGRGTYWSVYNKQGNELIVRLDMEWTVIFDELSARPAR